MRYLSTSHQASTGKGCLSPLAVLASGVFVPDHFQTLKFDIDSKDYAVMTSY